MACCMKPCIQHPRLCTVKKPERLRKSMEGRTKIRPTILCFSHLRWNFVYQRPQHLLSRAAAHADIFYVEEPILVDEGEASLRRECPADGVEVITPLLPSSYSAAQQMDAQRALLDAWLSSRSTEHLILWYYTPMALLFTDHLQARVRVYDCMDQLAAFQGAPPQLLEQEERLFKAADVVFTGGRSLFDEKRNRHRNVHLFPSSVDVPHFAAARSDLADAVDQQEIPHPRIGFFGVLDERLDCELLQSIAACNSAWHFVLIGPVVKIRHDSLPQASNIHYLGQKSYKELPTYLAHWDVAMLPFAQNASTRFISPTKTPEYLAAGKPVISTPIRDVVEPYGRLGLSHIAGTAEEFCTAIQHALDRPREGWLSDVDDFLSHTSWDRTFAEMWNEVSNIAAKNN
ncbi:glycosyltransferase family 1 protein [Acidipila sp. EB88]|uniref:glycosyltransferase family 1 protein n=1 Tax=Acidipila sp. EB88 TaxID=2305226 RepID=UPI001F2D2C89|nr:glycosyltransferase family 1 protein [Acidipila sp. EB88]